MISSSNFTEAARERNIEAGIVIHDPGIVVALSRQFDNLTHRGTLTRVPGISN